MTTARQKSKSKHSNATKVIKVKPILKNLKQKSPRPHLKFAGPILVSMAASSNYRKTLGCAVLVGFIHLSIGATNFSVLHYTISSGDIHASLFCLAFHFFSAEAVLCLSYANGWSAPMRMRHRRLVHASLQICGTACMVAGTVLVIVARGISLNFHVISGLSAIALAVIGVITGVIAWKTKRLRFVNAHVSFGIPTLFLSLISLCSGLLSKPFIDWAGNSIFVYILIALFIFVTMFLILSTFIKCVSKM